MGRAGLPGALGAPPDWVILGLALSVVGAFLLGTAVLLQSPRELIEERFGRARRNLQRIRDPIFARVQLGLGFAFLMAGFGLQLYGRLRAPAPEASGGTAHPAFWIGVVVVLATALSALGWWWSNVAFRRHLRAYFEENPPPFETDLELAREVGLLFGVAPVEEDTVESFVARLRREANLPPPARPRPVAATPEAEHETADLPTGLLRPVPPRTRNPA